ncbi:MAG: large conductance mechanosensitive channel protein MscL [Akkermansia sp.]|nr:large conductance mechanosensitive channel protein MscL [Akkermansia sp.]
MEINKITPAWVKEFKEFALKGNVMDMAVGVIIGGAFGKIVTSLVNDVIMPAILLVSPNTTLETLAWNGIKYGTFVQTIIDFLIISLSIFFAIRVLCKLRAKDKEEPKEEAPAPTPEDIQLLREIRDALRK